MPEPRIRACQRVYQQYPDREQRSVVATAVVHALLTPNVRRKQSRKVVPRSKLRILNDLEMIVVNKVRVERGKKQEESSCTGSQPRDNPEWPSRHWRTRLQP